MTTTAYALQARQQKAEYAESIGIDGPLISDLVETFYARIREHELLGPIFEDHVTDWTAHLARMRDFWASIAIESGRFHGNPMIKHIAIGNLERHHFDAWLALFFATLEDVVPGELARGLFRERAARIADSLHMGIEVDRSGLDKLQRKSVREKTNEDG